MLIPKSFSTPCDACDAPGPYPHGAAAVARGATGRWCEVLWICEKCAAAQGEVTPRLAAADYIFSLGDNDWPDFDYLCGEEEPEDDDDIIHSFSTGYLISSPDRGEDLSLFYFQEYQQ